jgi:hypothetical protein
MNWTAPRYLSNERLPRLAEGEARGKRGRLSGSILAAPAFGSAREMSSSSALDLSVMTSMLSCRSTDARGKSSASRRAILASRSSCALIFALGLGRPEGVSAACPLHPRYPISEPTEDRSRGRWRIDLGAKNPLHLPTDFGMAPRPNVPNRILRDFGRFCPVPGGALAARRAAASGEQARQTI